MCCRLWLVCAAAVGAAAALGGRPAALTKPSWARRLDEAHAHEDGDAAHEDAAHEEHGKNSFHYCEEGCEICESTGCVMRWTKEVDAGKHKSWEYHFVAGILTIAFIVITLVFERLQERAYEVAASRSDTLVTNHARRTSFVAKELTPHARVTRRFLQQYRGVPPRDKKHLRNLHDMQRGREEKTLNYVSRVVDRCHAELAVLGFLAFFVFVLERLGAFEALVDALGGEDGHRWFPQRAAELDMILESVHFALFVGMCLFFAVMAAVADRALRASTRWFLYEERLAEERRAGRARAPEDPAFAAGLAWYRKQRDRFVDRVSERAGGEAVTVDFNFAVYLKVNLDLLFDDLIEVSVYAWAFLVFLLGLKIALARCYQYFSGMPAVEDIFCWFAVANVGIWGAMVWAGHRCLEAGEAAGVRRLSDRGLSANHEWAAVRVVQGFCLFNVYSFADALFWFSYPATRHLHRTHTPVLLPVVYCLSLAATFALAPVLVVNGNVLFRVPPFVDETDLETVAEVAKLSEAPPPAENAPLVAADGLRGAEDV